MILMKIHYFKKLVNKRKKSLKMREKEHKVEWIRRWEESWKSWGVKNMISKCIVWKNIFKLIS